LIKRESYQTEKKDKVYDTLLYTYYANKLVEEKRIIQTGETSYILKFTYTVEGLPFETIQDKKKDELNIVYAKDYRLMNDLEIVLKAWRNIGKS